ncbi:30S ribosomal protein S2 [Candidatus Beckwithbacteria bacterium CG10_big_fil_rev_8_21_14_0_10_34_10]|uniref:Small ribosomal subunit protein uS2 n=1 Tax=Candidatus Beckwithbacteria bacterium CG10_big_fil_rev_8_21_14_0_10_34_10 TaxID=1974495 RepID=A0A2H0W9J6_9BACT|nr:MAG: 30S ribosomal protein S2 [Candidatus Beckwithbacteria bacterium CG10_big_fil_rev_8_21_14_0_10_34_10]
MKKTDSNYDIPLKDLLEAGCHFGHQKRRWNPKMDSFIWKEKEGVHIFDLAITAAKLKEACIALRDLVKEGGEVIFIGTKRQAEAVIKEEAKKTGAFYICSRWLGGTITNWDQIKKSLDKLVEMKEKKEKGEYEKYTKKENVLIDRDINRLSRFFEGLIGLKGNPQALFVIDQKREIAAVKEAKSKGIKVFAMLDSNGDPDLVDYPIPANDDAVRSIKLIVEKMAQAVADGKALRGKTPMKDKQEKK